jgi:serine/threonine protein kinase
MGTAALGPPLPKPGDKLAGKYLIVRVIGEGGMGVVYEAKHLRMKARVAIKMLSPAVAKDAEFRVRFEREAQAAGALKGPNVARILDVDSTSSDLPYLVMEFLEGNDLSRELEARGRLPISEAVDYVLQACDAMVEAHAAKIVHRDLKPSNLFLCAAAEEGGRIVKVLDFGVSKTGPEAGLRLTATRATLGTPMYMSPEQIRSSRNVDERTDVWSLGVILFELLTGRMPFHGESSTAVAAAIVADPCLRLRDILLDAPPELDLTVYKALEKDPKERYESVASFAAALTPFVDATVPRRRALSLASIDERPPGNPLSTRQVVVGASGSVVAETERSWSTHSTSNRAARWSKVLAGAAATAAIIAGVAWLNLRSTLQSPVTAAVSVSGPVVSPPPVDPPTVSPQPAFSGATPRLPDTGTASETLPASAPSPPERSPSAATSAPRPKPPRSRPSAVVVDGGTITNPNYLPL